MDWTLDLDQDLDLNLDLDLGPDLELDKNSNFKASPPALQNPSISYLVSSNKTTRA